MKILLTGPNSFCGKVILKLLAQKGYDLTAISRTKAYLNYPSINVHYIENDLAEISHISKKFDAVIHIAATAPMPGITATHLIKDNIIATQNLIKSIQNSHIKKFIFFSTCSVYGEVNQSSLTENTPICNPCLYGMTKLIGESMLEEQNAFQSLAIRAPSIMGYGAKRHWLATTIDKAKKDEPISIYHPNALFNNAISLQALAVFIDHLLSFKWPKDFDCINVASQNGLPIGDIVKNVVSQLNSNSTIKIETSNKMPFTISSQYAIEKYGFKPMEFSKELNDYLGSAVNTPKETLQLDCDKYA